MYLNVRVITDDTFRAYSGTDLTVWEINNNDPSAPRAYRVLRKSTVKELIERIADETGSDPKRIRVWAMVNRQNKTIRPDVPIPDPNITVEEAYQKLAGTKSQDLRLWAELAEEVDSEGNPVWPTHTTLQNGASGKTDIIVLFLKWFDIEEQTLMGAGHIYISREKKVEDLVPVILKKMQWPEKSPTGDKTQLKLFEVCEFSFASNASRC